MSDPTTPAHTPGGDTHEDWEGRYDQQMAKAARHVARARTFMEDRRHGFALLGATAEGQIILALEALIEALYVPEEEAAARADARAGAEGED